MATIVGFAAAFLSGLVASVAAWCALFQRQPGVNILGNSSCGLAFALLTHPERFTERGQRSRRIYIRAIQGFFASLLAILCGGLLSGREDFRFNPPLVLWPVVAVDLLLILAVLERLRRR